MHDIYKAVMFPVILYESRKPLCSGVCPHCENGVSFSAVDNFPDQLHSHENIKNLYGIRICPLCKKAVFVVVTERWEDGQQIQKLAEIHPTPKLDIEGVNDVLLEIIYEAKVCHQANCNRAAAVMIRRAVEELCILSGAKSFTLAQKIDEIKNINPNVTQYVDGLHKLRILGNENAHNMETRRFDDITHEAVEIALEMLNNMLDGIIRHQASMSRLDQFMKE